MPTNELVAEIERLNAKVRCAWDDRLKMEKEICRLRAELREARKALHNIQHANGSPNDEDYVTTEARDALARIEKCLGEK